MLATLHNNPGRAHNSRQSTRLSDCYQRPTRHGNTAGTLMYQLAMLTYWLAGWITSCRLLSPALDHCNTQTKLVQRSLGLFPSGCTLHTATMHIHITAADIAGNTPTDNRHHSSTTAAVPIPSMTTGVHHFEGAGEGEKPPDIPNRQGVERDRIRPNTKPPKSQTLCGQTTPCDTDIKTHTLSPTPCTSQTAPARDKHSTIMQIIPWPSAAMSAAAAPSISHPMCRHPSAMPPGGLVNLVASILKHLEIWCGDCTPT